jgi:hypothetical protein
MANVTFYLMIVKYSSEQGLTKNEKVWGKSASTDHPNGHH